MLQALKGNIIQAPKAGVLSITEHGFLVLENGSICGIWPELPEEYAAAEVTDYGDKLIMQSFADMHLHGAQYPMIGLGMDLPLMEWLNTYAFPVEARFADNDYARRIYRRLASDLIANGTTRVCMFASLHTDAALILMEELEKAGLSGYVGKVNMDICGIHGVLQEGTEESAAETVRWLESCRFEHIKPIITPRFTPGCSAQLLGELGHIAEERGLYVQSHLSENVDEVQLVRNLHPDCDRYWETYNKYGLWKDHTIMAHCIYSDAEERAAMRDNGVLAVHCADSNVNICSGICPVRRLLEDGVWVALGSDIAGGAQLSMLQVITSSIRASKNRRICDNWQSDFLSVAEAYYLATTSGHKYFGDGDGFAAGNKLHALVMDDSGFVEPAAPLSLRQRFERAVYLGGKENICAVWSEGRCVKGLA